MVYVSDATELGTVYTRAELTALRAACDAHGMYLYLDGARLAQALTAAGSDLQPENLPRLCDAFYIGGTKTACSSARQWSSSTTRSSRASAAR